MQKGSPSSVTVDGVTVSHSELPRIRKRLPLCSSFVGSCVYASSPPVFTQSPAGPPIHNILSKLSTIMIGERGLSSCRGIDVKYLVDISYI